MIGVLKGEELSVQGLPGKVDGGKGRIYRAKSGVVCAVADERKAGMGGLDTNLMFATGFKLESQFSDKASVCERVFGKDFEVSDGFLGLGRRDASRRRFRRKRPTLLRRLWWKRLALREDLLAEFIAAQLEPLTPGTFWRT